MPPPRVRVYTSCSMVSLISCYTTQNCFLRAVVAGFKTIRKMLAICVEITASNSFVVLQIRCYKCSRGFTLALGHGGEEHPILLYSRVLQLRAHLPSQYFCYRQSISQHTSYTFLHIKHIYRTKSIEWIGGYLAQVCVWKIQCWYFARYWTWIWLLRGNQNPVFGSDNYYLRYKASLFMLYIKK